jgi:hypothetical protein
MNVGRAWFWMEKHIRLGWILAVFGGLAVIAWWALDRDPPFRELRYYQPAPVHAGEDVSIELDVDRDVERSCSVSVSRFFMDSAGYRTDYSPPQFLNAEGIKKREAVDQGKLKLKFRIPDSMPEGRATLNTESLYSCAGNPLHAIWPIRVSSSWAFDVLPPAKVKTIIIQGN